MSSNPDIFIGPVSTAVEHGESDKTTSLKTHLKNRIGKEKDTVVEDGEESINSEPHKPVCDHTHRKLKPRHVELIGWSRLNY